MEKFRGEKAVQWIWFRLKRGGAPSDFIWTLDFRVLMTFELLGSP